MNTNSEKNNMWRSVEAKERQKYETQPEPSNEFPAAVTELIEKGFNYSLDRKKFLTIMGASLSMAGINCVRQPAEKIVPYVTRPPEAQPGIPVYYATARVDHRGVLPELVKTRDGKPIKIDGHDEHPVQKGAMTAGAFAEIWNLYDPDRLKTSMEKSDSGFTAIDTAGAIEKAKEILKNASNVRVLSRSSYSPSEKKAKSSFLSSAGAKSVVYDATGNQAQVQLGDQASFGKAIIPNYRFDNADLIVSIGADFLGTWIAPELFTKQFSSNRNPDKKMNRLIVAESMLSLTGANADTRIPVSAGSHLAFALGLASELASGTSYAGSSILRSVDTAQAAQMAGVDASVIKNVAKELKGKKGRSLVVAGGANALDGNIGSIQIVANLINAILGNDGKTVDHSAPIQEDGDISSPSEVAKLLADMKNGKVDVLVLDRANPVYDLPEDSGVREAIKNVKSVIAIADHLDESANEANLVIAANHYLESWNDGYSAGVYTIAQPVIRPLFDTLNPGDIWLQLAGSETAYYDFIRNTARTRLGGSFEISWEKLLSDGYSVVKRGGSTGGRSFKSGALGSISAPKANSGLTLTIYESVQMGDGISANNSYLHELPDPVTKICWDNFVAVSKADAEENNWRLGDVLEVNRDSYVIQAPLYIQPGLKKGSLALALGYGHDKLGKVADGLGANAWKLAKFTKNGIVTDGLAVAVKKVDDGYRIATTQRHHEMHGRGLVRYASLAEYKSDSTGKAGSHQFDLGLKGRGLYPIHDYSVHAEGKGGYKWGMAIDLSKCTGCSACVISCYSENNIPVTGRDEVWRGREMSWMRIDRYFEGEIDNPTTHFAPVMCQHCENAPCENVCPVNATQHSSEGLNDMAYNRCIGTRYCSDNCPFKVRRFNWFENWEGKISDPAQYALNPDVTVRGRGVIEKCSFCVQRINEQRQMAKAEGRQIDEKDLKTACQQGCPADAIYFGDLANKDTVAAKEWYKNRGYRMLDEVNVESRIKYLTRIINQG